MFNVSMNKDIIYWDSDTVPTYYLSIIKAVYGSVLTPHTGAVF